MAASGTADAVARRVEIQEGRRLLITVPGGPELALELRRDGAAPRVAAAPRPPRRLRGAEFRWPRSPRPARAAGTWAGAGARFGSPSVVTAAGTG